MAVFKPVLIDKKGNLTEEKVPIVNGQYIIVLDKNEIYLDKNGIREKVSQNVYFQVSEPTNVKPGDIWVQIEEEKI